MGLLENQRRKRHELSLDWNELVMMMLLDHELDMAERAGVPEHVRTQSATRIRDAVVAKVGQPGIVRVFIDTDYEMRTPDKDAVVARALAASGYDDARRDLPPEVMAVPVASTAPVAAGPRWDDDDVDELVIEEPRWDDEPLELEAEPVPLAPRVDDRVPEPVSSPLPGVAVEDAEAYDVAKRAVQSWRDRFPHVVEQAVASDGGRTTPATLVAEGYTAARSARGDGRGRRLADDDVRAPEHDRVRPGGAGRHQGVGGGVHADPLHRDGLHAPRARPRRRDEGVRAAVPGVLRRLISVCDQCERTTAAASSSTSSSVSQGVPLRNAPAVGVPNMIG